ncbi:ABC transporter permease [Dyadobacter psychrotolerans]|uniref:ABC transporter permease n=1 Tax=Dyadobacter psychrotolerans TaxID=2541721 RepID=A0A4R5DV35_9BACT|nr:ABC transporter permease [Dyadobacter psychrotolerans]TDE16374.1 ABC transporter permease [Dyadobacter psychrotolerans]
MLLNYIKIAWKVLLRHPFYTFITLFGISLTLTVLMVLTSFLDHLFGTHYPENKRFRSLYIANVLQTDSSGTSMSSGPASFNFLEKYAKSLKTAEKVTVVSNFSFSNTYINGKRIKLNTKYTDAEFWDVVSFDFLEGKPYNIQNINSGDHVAVITDALRKQYFEDDNKPVVGKSIEVENIKYRIIGVVKGSPVTRVYTYGDIYFPYTAPKSNYESKGMRGRYIAIALAKDESDMAGIQSEFDRNISGIPDTEIADGQKFTVLIVRAEKYFEHFIKTFARNDSQKFLFYTIVVFVVMMFMGLPAINLINVNVSRILERASEIGVRKAFGAPSKALLWQFIVENIFITFIGGVFALGFSFLIIYMINISGWIPYADLTINFTVFFISVMVCLIFGLLSGVLPAFRMSKLKIVDALKA